MKSKMHRIATRHPTARLIFPPWLFPIFPPKIGPSGFKSGKISFFLRIRHAFHIAWRCFCLPGGPILNDQLRQAIVSRLMARGTSSVFLSFLRAYFLLYLFNAANSFFLVLSLPVPSSLPFMYQLICPGAAPLLPCPHVNSVISFLADFSLLLSSQERRPR